MMKIPLPVDTRKSKRILRFFLNNILRGAIVTAPVIFTFMGLLWLFNAIDRFLPDILRNILDFIFEGKIKMPYIPGLGLITIVLFLMMVGYISKFFVFNKFMKSLDAYLEKAPGIKFIYTTLKDMISNLSGSKKKFDKPVLVAVDEHKKMYKMGFITQEDLDALNLHDFIAVYMPMSFSIAGNIYFVHKENITFLENVDSATAMKFLISGGVSDLKKTNKHLEPTA